MSHAATYLMYHELQRPGRALCYPDEGYARYVIPEERFKAHLELLRGAGFSGLSVGQHLASQLQEPAVVFTFDDGCETDFLIAAPLLKEFGFSATCYVVSSWVGRAGFLRDSQLRELTAAGFEIGSHSQSHAFLTDLTAAQLHKEVHDSKKEIEDMLGQPVKHFSCPGGRWNASVMSEARSAGYESFALSRVGVNQPQDRFALRRVAIRSGTSAGTVLDWARGNRMLRMRAVASILDAGKALLGNRLYEKVRAAALGSD